MIHVMAVIRVQPERLAAVVAEMSALAVKSRAEPGCIRYEVFRREGEAVLVTQEVWTDPAAESAHMSGPNVAAVIAAVGAYLTAPPEIHRYSQIA